VRRPAGVLDLDPDLLARAEAGVDHLQALQLLERAAVDVEMIGLAPDGAVPLDADPAQVLEDALLELRPAALPVDVLDPEQEPAARHPRRLVGEQRGIGVAQVQVAGRAGREPRDVRRLAFARCREVVTALDHADAAIPDARRDQRG
jgi:hypothetical protein